MKAKKTKLALWICAIVVLLVASILVPSVQKTETIQVTMRDAVLHETNRISLFGIKDVNPALISAWWSRASCWCLRSSCAFSSSAL